MDIIAIRDPWVYSINKSMYEPSHSNIHRLPRKGKERARVSMYVNLRIDIDSWEGDFSSKDSCSTNLNIQEEGNAEGDVEL